MQCIFIHGLGQHPSSWNNVADCLHGSVQANYPDLISLLTYKEITYNHLYNAFKDYCAKLDEPLHLCGLSLGAVLALNYTIEHPEKVKSLILIAPQYKMPRLLLTLQNIIFRFMPEVSFQEMGFNKKEMITLTKSMKTLDFSNQIKNIICAALVVCGSKDNANKKAAKKLTENIQGARLQVVESAGHEVNVDAPEKLAAAIHSFWKEGGWIRV